MGQEETRFLRCRIAQAALVLAAIALCATAILPTAALGAPTAITEFPVEVGHPVDLEGLVVGGDGNIWYQEHWWPEGSYHALIGRMDEAGGVEEFDEGLTKYSSPAEFVAGPDGNLWFADGGSALGGASIGKISPKGAITRFTAGLGGSQPRTIVMGPDGNFWFTGIGDSPAIGFATPEGAISAFSLPGKPWDAVGGPDGNIWFTYGGEGVTPAIGRLVREEDGGAVVTLFHSGLAADSHPFQIIAARDGHLWFSDLSDTMPAIGRVSMNGEINEFSLAQDGGIWDIAAGPTGDIWFTNPGGDDVGRVSPQGQITEVGNGELIEPRNITSGADGNMWFTYWGGIGKVSTSGDVTRFRQGISPSVSPREIVSGPGGRLWFVATGLTTSAIGRIIPGDDGPLPASKSSRGSSPPPFAMGRLALQKASVPVSRGGMATIHLACQSSAPCMSRLQLVAYRRRWQAGRLIGASSFSIGAWGSVGVRVQVNRTGRKLLAQGDEATIRLQVSPSATALPLNQRLKLTAPWGQGRRSPKSLSRLAASSTN